MSGYGYPSSYPEQSDISTYTTAYPTVPQYTQTQLNQYFTQYHCYPPQPYQIVSDFYTQPVAPPLDRSPPQAVLEPTTVLQNTHQPSFDVPLGYEDPAAQWLTQSIPYEPPQSPAQSQDQGHSQSPTT
ncbi:hypothetical protein E8E11_007107 [Didymella keratinophila]|nr:hypothetical protein E8E11_007107 [Didymella keratinophila]